MHSQSKSPKIRESWIIFIIGAVQFINVLDFMMVMPMGPDFAQALAIPTSKLGIIGGSYTAAAGITGILGSFVLDRFDRRKALALAMLGLAVGTVLGGFATGLGTLVMARILAGVFGGPATSISLSIVADVVPPERRGRAMGAVMGAFSIASILGVPAGLELARVGGWRLPFFAVAAVSLVITSLAYFFLPRMTDHIKPGAKKEFSFATVSFLKRPMVLNAYVLVGLQMFANFMIVPNLSAFFQFNVGYPRAGLGVLYMVGGITSFFTMRIAGWLIDRFSASKVFTGASGIVILVLCLGFVLFPPHLPILLIFTGFMVGVSVRNISVQSVSTRVPNANERAGYMSFQSAVQHFSSAAGAILSSWMLTESSTGALIGFDHVAVISVCVAFVMPFLLQRLEGFVRRHESHVREHFLAEP